MHKSDSNAPSMRVPPVPERPDARLPSYVLGTCWTVRRGDPQAVYDKLAEPYNRCRQKLADIRSGPKCIRCPPPRMARDPHRGRLSRPR
ncbi:MAG: hypothetical protein F4140_06885 [Cenarchaeum sp. SB0675_bin_21]|nr:hypothetical protein [Cenarchaeum sp. SB0675_bin_21]